jgi:DNA-binding PadR family transcriptional regulator
MHGYQLAEFIEHNMGGWTDIKKPTTYFLLDKMAEAGWIACEQSQEGNRPPRRVYSLTPQGETVFQELLRKNLSGYTPELFPNDIGIAFLHLVPVSEGLNLLRQRLNLMQQYHERLSAAPLHPGQAQWVLEHQLRHIDLEIKWVEEMLGRLQETN